MQAERSLRAGGLPIGLAHGVKVVHPVSEGEIVTWADVEVDETGEAVRVRREMEAMFGERQP
jgi:predicted homoserine dehydrogenase-like protein